ncbi:MAG TPA: hypothetical protein VNN73_05640 [Blastocatellia bacterium]|nr:hypothetical protein [Blastocatellia bacterium]
MKTRLIAIISALALFGFSANGRNVTFQQDLNAITPQTITLYPPSDKASDKYDETRACFSFKFGRNKSPNSTDWDLGYGFANIGGEDWLMVGTTSRDKRSVMKELGEYNWSDNFEIQTLEPLPELKEGEQRHITLDSSADTHKAWARSTTHFAKAKAGHIYLLHVKDSQADFYVLFRIEEIEQQHHCTISWKRVPQQ